MPEPLAAASPPLPPPPGPPRSWTVEDRVRRTLLLAADRGYGLPADRLAALLLGGSIGPRDLGRAIAGMPDVVRSDGVVLLRGSQSVLGSTSRRLRAHDADSPAFLAIAREYAAALVRVCPSVRAIGLAGSLSTGGFATGDDIDLDLVVADGTKFRSYLAAQALGAVFDLRYRRRVNGSTERLLSIPKILCINVVWEEHQTLPFVRRDEQMALELLLTRPLVNPRLFGRILAANSWLEDYFPQAAGREELAARSTPIDTGAPDVVGGGGRFPEEAARAGVRALHAVGRWSRRGNPAARRHAQRMESVKHPYGILEPAEADHRFRR